LLSVPFYNASELRVCRAARDSNPNRQIRSLATIQEAHHQISNVPEREGSPGTPTCRRTVGLGRS
jgi:hypothetical protein